MPGESFKARLLDLLQRARDEELAFTSELSEADRAANGTFENWSAMDVLAHIAEWRGRFAGRLAAWKRGQALPELSTADEYNAASWAANHGKSWSEVEAEGERSFADVLSQASQLTEAELTDPEAHVWYRKRSIASSLLINSYYHIPTHIAEFYQQRGEMVRAKRLMETATEQLLAIVPPQDIQGMVLYNLACFYARNGEPEHAIERLQEALPLRPELKEWAGHDPDLAALHDLPAYRALLATAN